MQLHGKNLIGASLSAEETEMLAADLPQLAHGVQQDRRSGRH
jgi:hypothetical protein